MRKLTLSPVLPELGGGNIRFQAQTVIVTAQRPVQTDQ